MKLKYVAPVFLLGLLFGAAHAQTPGCATVPASPNCVQIQGYQVTGVAALAAGNVSANVAFPTQSSQSNIVLYNPPGGVTAYYNAGNSTVVATTSNNPIPSPGYAWFPRGLNTNVAAVTATGAANLTVLSGTGTPTIVYGQMSVAGPVAVVTPPNTPLPTMPVPPPVTYGMPTTGTVNGAATLVSSPGNKVTKLCNTAGTGSGNIWLNSSGGTPAPGLGDEAMAGGGCVTYIGLVQNANGNIITGISDNGAVPYTVTLGN